MLNKLLKRCTPWMDKGRWYHMRAKVESVQDELVVTEISYDPIFNRHEVINESPRFGYLAVFFSDPQINATILDYKCIYNFSDDTLPKVTISSDNFVFNESERSIGAIMFPGSMDIWAFIQIN